MSYYDSASKGDILSTLRFGIVTGSLWAIGTSWATSIREIVILIFPKDNMNQALGELLSVFLTTILGVGTAVLVSIKCKSPPSLLFTRKKSQLPSKSVHPQKRGMTSAPENMGKILGRRDIGRRV